MNPSSKGWLKEYYSYFEKLEAPEIIQKDNTKYIYNLLSESSIIFSIPLEKSNALHPNLEQWNFKEKIKITFAYLLFKISESYILKNKFLVHVDEVYERFAQSQNSELSTEEYIDSIINGKKNSIFLNAYNSNPWLFFHLIEFYLFLEKENITNSLDLRFNIVKGMILAAKSNESVSKKEDRLLKRYIENGGFDTIKKEKLYSYTKIGTSFLEPNFENENLLIKQSAYDLALLALMTDSKIDQSELAFINQFADQLGIDLQDQYLSFSLIQDIHLNHYKSLPYLNKIYTVKSIRNIVSHNFTYVIKKNSGMIVNEIRESKELISLLRKSTNSKLSTEEKAKVKEQILDLIKTIPSLSIFMIPGGTIILPILMKILPDDLLYPSSFVNKNK